MSQPEETPIRLFFHWLKLKRFDRALEAGPEALEAEPANPFLHAGIGQAHLATGNSKLASQHLRRALSFDPENSDFQALLSLAELNCGGILTGRAEKEAFRTLALDVENYDAWFTLATSTFVFDRAFASRCCDRLLQLQPENPRGYLLKITFHELAEPPNLLLAENCLLQALKLAPDDESTHHAAALFYLDSGKQKKKALAFNQSALRINPNHEPSLTLNQILRNRRDWILKTLSFPLQICKTASDGLFAWSGHSAIFFTWPIALLLAFVVLTLFLLWSITLWPPCRLYEFLILKSSRSLSRFQSLLRLPWIARFPIWLGTSLVYFFATLSLLKANGKTIVDALIDYGWPAFLCLFFGGGILLIIYEWWKKRQLGRRTKKQSLS